MEASRWSRSVAIAAVLLLAGTAAVVSYSHMYELALCHGEPEWRAALLPLSVDGMIDGASIILLGDARRDRKGGLLPWSLVILGSVASSAANVAVADPTMWSRIIHTWPAFVLSGAYELLLHEFRTAARNVHTASASNDPVRRGAAHWGAARQSVRPSSMSSSIRRRGARGFRRSARIDNRRTGGCSGSVLGGRSRSPSGRARGRGEHAPDGVARSVGLLLLHQFGQSFGPVGVFGGPGDRGGHALR